MTPNMAQMINMANNQPQPTSYNVVADPKKQKRMESLAYVKAHFDVIAVSLLVLYLSYSLYQLNKNGK